MNTLDQSRLYAFYDRDPMPIVEFIEYLRGSYRLPRPGTLLDMGCGPGRLLAPLAGAGWAVTGYEPDPDYAGSAEKAVSELADCRFRHAGFLDLDERDAFDLIAAVNGPYCYLLSHQERRDALRRCRRALRPGGVLFLELSNFFWILKNYREPPTRVVEVGGLRVSRLARHVIDYHRGTFTHVDQYAWTDESGTEHSEGKTHRMAIVSFAEISYFLEDLGFDQIQTFNALADRAPSDLTGRKILVAARKTSAG